ncbi:MAG: GFA family protein [Rhodospirillaceae bacterium]
MRTYAGSCHCGAVQFEIDTELDQVGICNCSICSRRNAVMHRVPPERFRILKGEDALTHYTFNTGTAQHYFCRNCCGIYTFHRPRLAPDQYTVNVFCLEGVDADLVAGLKVNRFDGRSFSVVED